MHQGERQSQTENHLDYLISIYDRTMEGNRPSQGDEAIGWLKKNIPKSDKLVISWGDCRPGNMLFRDYECVGALDWEMCSLADPAADLGWWILGDKWFLGDTIDRLEGMLEGNKLMDVYESITGTRLKNVKYFEVFSGFRLLVIQTHMMLRWERAGQSLFGPDNSLDNNPSSRVLNKIMAGMC